MRSEGAALLIESRSRSSADTQLSALRMVLMTALMTTMMGVEAREDVMEAVGLAVAG